VILGVDNDGVWLNFADAVDDWAWRKHSQKPVPHDCWEFHQKWEQPAFMHTILNEPEFWHTVEPYPGAMEVLSDLQHAGHELVFITHRPDAARPATEYTFSYWELWWPLVFAEGPKWRPAKVYNVGLAVDDKPSEVRSYLKNDVKAVLLDRPWNQEADDLPRIFDLRELFEHIEEDKDD
jgi:hypothetical protein